MSQLMFENGLLLFADSGLAFDSGCCCCHKCGTECCYSRLSKARIQWTLNIGTPNEYACNSDFSVGDFTLPINALGDSTNWKVELLSGYHIGSLQGKLEIIVTHTCGTTWQAVAALYRESEMGWLLVNVLFNVTVTCADPRTSCDGFTATQEDDSESACNLQSGTSFQIDILDNPCEYVSGSCLLNE